MSRVGKQPIKIEDGIQVNIENGGAFNHQVVVVKGPKGELRQDIRKGIKVEVKNNEILLNKTEDTKMNRGLHGLYRSLINNMVKGVKEEFKKTLEIVGVGFKGAVKGNGIELSLGLTHPVMVAIPEGLRAEVKEGTEITIFGIDKEKVGRYAAYVRSIRKPEPYKGKGIRYQGEYVRRKAGKAAITTTE